MNILTVAGLGLIASAYVMPERTAYREPSQGQAAPAQSAPYTPVSERDARQIAWSSGLVHVEEIALDGNQWHVAGRDERDGEIALDIDAKTGRVVQ